MDYRIYQMKLLEKIKYSLLYMALFVLIAWLFYRNLWVSLVGILLLPYLLRKRANQMMKQRAQRLALQFQELLLSFQNALVAGYSIENAFSQAYHDLQYFFPIETEILRECENIELKMKNNEPLEVLLFDFGQRSGVSDIHDFAAIFQIAKKSGGDFNKMILDTASIIHQKIEVRSEIAVLLANKKMEQTIMNIVPIGIMLYIQISSPGYFDALYGNAVGIVMMTVCLALYFFAYFLSEKIMEIEI